MLELNEAYEIAKKEKHDINHYTEYENVFVFGNVDDESFGGTSPVVIDRDNGDALMFVYALSNGMLDSDPISEGSI